MAIARDATSQTNGIPTGTTISVSHTCTGSNLILFAGVAHSKNEAATCTYNGVSMTEIGTSIFTNRNLHLFYLVNPATGTHTLEATLTSGTSTEFAWLLGMSYTGAAQTGQPDSTNKGSRTSVATQNLTVSTTVIASNCWLAAAYLVDTPGVSTVTTGSLNVTSTRAQGDELGIDSNGTVGTGSQSISVQDSASGDLQSMIVASFAPYVAPATNSGFFHGLNLLGVGN